MKEKYFFNGIRTFHKEKEKDCTGASVARTTLPIHVYMHEVKPYEIDLLSQAFRSKLVEIIKLEVSIKGRFMVLIKTIRIIKCYQKWLRI